jgi:hypothetical protein
MALARKSIKQSFRASAQLLSVMENFRQMTNDCIRIGMEFEKSYDNRTPSMKRLSLLSYGELRRRYGGYSQYALCAISTAAGILSARRKSIKRGFRTKAPYAFKPVLVSCYGFEVANGNLIVRIDSETFETIPLNSRTRTLLSDSELRIHSFILTKDSVSLCVSKYVKEMGKAELTGATGIDRNLRNVAAGDGHVVTLYDMTKAVDIGENTRSIVGSFKRADVRIRRRISAKYGKRRNNRTKYILNQVSKNIVREAKSRRQVIVLEESEEFVVSTEKGTDRESHTELG